MAGESVLQSLPEELVAGIASWLDIRSLARLGSCSRACRRASWTALSTRAELDLREAALDERGAAALFQHASKCTRLRTYAWFLPETAFGLLPPTVQDVDIEDLQPRRAAEALRRLARRCPQLKRLRVTCSDLDYWGMDPLDQGRGRGSTELDGCKRRIVRGGGFSPRGCSPAGPAPMESPAFDAAFAFGSGLQAVFDRCRALESLSVPDFGGRASAPPVATADLPCLRELSIGYVDPRALGPGRLTALAVSQYSRDEGVSCTSDAFVFRLVAELPGLVSLSLRGFGGPVNGALTDEAFVALSRLGALEKLKLGMTDSSFFGSVTDVGILHLAASCRSLRVLHLSGFRRLTDSAVTALARSCGDRLEKLRLEWFSRATDLALDALAAACTRLRALSVRDARRATDGGMAELLAARGSALERLCLSNCAVGPATMQALRESCGGGRLRELNLNGCSAACTDDGFAHLAQALRCLRRLTLKSCRALTEAGLATLAAHCGELRDVDLSFCPEVKDAGVAALAVGAPRLRRLRLDGCSRLTNRAIAALAAGPTGLSLRELSAEGLKLTPAVGESLACFAALQRAALSVRLPGRGAGGLRWLARRCPDLALYCDLVPVRLEPDDSDSSD